MGVLQPTPLIIKIVSHAITPPNNIHQLSVEYFPIWKIKFILLYSKLLRDLNARFSNSSPAFLREHNVQSSPTAPLFARATIRESSKAAVMLKSGKKRYRTVADTICVSITYPTIPFNHLMNRKITMNFFYWSNYIVISFSFISNILVPIISKFNWMTGVSVHTTCKTRFSVFFF